MAKIENTSSLTSKYSLPDGTQKQNSVTSNTSTTENMTTALEKVRTSSKNFGVPEDEIEITLKLTNNSEYDVENLTLTDTISSDATFKAGSLKVDGGVDASGNPTTGYTLTTPITASGGMVTISYTISIAESPNDDKVTTTSEITYSAADADDLTETLTTIEIPLTIEGMEITQKVSKQVVVAGQTITFSNIITNNGNVKNTELFFSNNLPAGTEFISESVKVDEVSMPTYNPNDGFNLKDLDTGNTVKVSFDVKVL